MPVALKKFDPFVVLFDGEPVRLHLKSLRQDEYAVFKAQFLAFGQGRKERSAGAPQDPGPDTPSLAQANAAWFRDVFANYVAVEPGDVTFEDVPVTTGLEFLDLVLRSHDRVIVDVLGQLYLENTLSPAQKKTLRSRLASMTGSATALPKTASGDAPAPVATAVEKNASAPSAAATDPSGPPSSGTTAPSSFAAVPSGS